MRIPINTLNSFVILSQIDKKKLNLKQLQAAKIFFPLDSFVSKEKLEIISPFGNEKIFCPIYSKENKTTIYLNPADSQKILKKNFQNHKNIKQNITTKFKNNKITISNIEIFFPILLINTKDFENLKKNFGIQKNKIYKFIIPYKNISFDTKILVSDNYFLNIFIPKDFFHEISDEDRAIPLQKN